MLKHDWLKTNEAALLECIKTLLTFSLDPELTISQLYKSSIRPCLNLESDSDEEPEISITNQNAPSAFKLLMAEQLKLARKCCQQKVMRNSGKFLEKWSEIAVTTSSMVRASVSCQPKELG